MIVSFPEFLLDEHKFWVFFRSWPRLESSTENFWWSIKSKFKGEKVEKQETQLGFEVLRGSSIRIFRPKSTNFGFRRVWLHNNLDLSFSRVLFELSIVHFRELLCLWQEITLTWELVMQQRVKVGKFTGFSRKIEVSNVLFFFRSCLFKIFLDKRRKTFRCFSGSLLLLCFIENGLSKSKEDFGANV